MDIERQRGIVLRYFLTGRENSNRIAYGQSSGNEKRLEEERFNENSDIDLAVEGLPGSIFFEALGELLLPSRFPLNLIPLKNCPESLRKKIITTGKHL